MIEFIKDLNFLNDVHFFFPFFPFFFDFLPALRLASNAFSKLSNTDLFSIRGGISNYYTWVAVSIKMTVIFSRANNGLRTLTVVRYVVVLKIVPRQCRIFDHAELHSLKDVFIIVKLVVC